MPSDDQPPISAESIKMVWPTDEQRESRLAEIRRYAPGWTAPAVLIIKPDLGLIVSPKRIDYDDRYFTLRLVLDEILVAPDGFDAQAPLHVSCVWNQPYLSLSADCINAAYSFRLHFGTEGVRRVRELSRTNFFAALKNTGVLPSLLGACFLPNYKPPEE